MRCATIRAGCYHHLSQGQPQLDYYKYDLYLPSATISFASISLLLSTTSLQQSYFVTMSQPAPGYFTYNCKNFQTHNCKGKVLVAQTACNACVVASLFSSKPPSSSCPYFCLLGTNKAAGRDNLYNSRICSEVPDVSVPIIQYGRVSYVKVREEDTARLWEPGLLQEALDTSTEYYVRED